MADYKTGKKECRMEIKIPQFDDETWAMLPSFFEHLPEPVLLNIWGDATISKSVAEAVKLAQTLSERFELIKHQLLPMRMNFHYYPVIGIMRISDGVPIDHGVRFVGLPVGFQMTSLIAGIQSVSFQGSTSEATTRIQLHRLDKSVNLELFTDAQDESGAQMAQAIFNMAVVSEHIRSFLIMKDEFPEAAIRYSVREVPHLVINGKAHIQGLVDENAILAKIANTITIVEEKTS
jgi:alkyl hydroperoxide reductase subunit AhpF